MCHVVDVASQQGRQLSKRVAANGAAVDKMNSSLLG
jgi:hypothetical protein